MIPTILLNFANSESGVDGTSGLDPLSITTRASIQASANLLEKAMNLEQVSCFIFPSVTLGMLRFGVCRHTAEVYASSSIYPLLQGLIES